MHLVSGMEASRRKQGEEIPVRIAVQYTMHEPVGPAPQPICVVDPAGEAYGKQQNDKKKKDTYPQVTPTVPICLKVFPIRSGLPHGGHGDDAAAYGAWRAGYSIVTQ